MIDTVIHFIKILAVCQNKRTTGGLLQLNPFHKNIAYFQYRLYFYILKCTQMRETGKSLYDYVPKP